MALCDSLGNLVKMVLLPGNRNDIVGVPPLLEAIKQSKALLADKGFDADRLFEALDAAGIEAVMPKERNAATIGRLTEKNIAGDML